MNINFSEPIDYSGALAVAVGRGQTGEDEPVSDELRKVYVHILPEEECKQTGYTKGKVTDNMFCAGYLEGQYDSCSVRNFFNYYSFITIKNLKGRFRMIKISKLFILFSGR